MCLSAILVCIMNWRSTSTIWLDLSAWDILELQTCIIFYLVHEETMQICYIKCFVWNICMISSCTKQKIIYAWFLHETRIDQAFFPKRCQSGFLWSLSVGVSSARSFPAKRYTESIAAGARGVRLVDGPGTMASNHGLEPWPRTMASNHCLEPGPRTIRRWLLVFSSRSASWMISTRNYGTHFSHRYSRSHLKRVDEKKKEKQSEEGNEIYCQLEHCS